uniref:NR LBD domain-containing protein n=1 Tax=Caenorhabditis tropicalis TaxID=1561998 RepID=A0A1I7UJJ1_9PELO
MHKQLAEANGMSYPMYGDYSPPPSHSYCFDPNMYHYQSGTSTPVNSYPIPVTATPVTPMPQQTMYGATPSSTGSSNHYAHQATGGSFPSPQVPEEDVVSRVISTFDQQHHDFRNAPPPVGSDVDSDGFGSLDRAGGWELFSKQLEPLVKTIIEFAKGVEGFTHLPQETQIQMLKGSVFELCLIFGAMYYNMDSHAVCWDRFPIPFSAIMSEDATEMSLVNEVHTTLHEIVALQPNTSELALLSACLLLDQSSSPNVGMLDTATIATTEMLKNALHSSIGARLGCMEMTANRIQEVETRIRQTARLHQEALQNFRLADPIASSKLPDLYKELFTIDRP